MTAKSFVLFLILLLVMTACGSSDDPTKPAEPPVVTSGPATAIPVPTITPTVATPIPSGSGMATAFIFSPAEETACSVRPISGMATVYTSPTRSDSLVLGVFSSNTWIAVTALNDGWYSINHARFDGFWVPSDTVELSESCVCATQCGSFELQLNEVVDVSNCIMGFAVDAFIEIYYLPDANSELFSISTAGDDNAGMVLARTEDGWVGFDPGVAQAENAGLRRLRWIQESDDVTLKGDDCDSVPVYNYSTNS